MRGLDGEVRAFHNICRHRGNKLVWQDYPREETQRLRRQFVCKYHGWQYDLDGACTFVQQEGEFFDLDKADFGLVPVHCDVLAGFIFVNLDREPSQSLRDFLGPMIAGIEDYPFDQMTERYYYRAEVGSNWKVFIDAFKEFYHAPVVHVGPASAPLASDDHRDGLRGAALPDRGSARGGHDRGLDPPRVGDAAREREAAGPRRRAAGCSARGSMPDLGELPPGVNPGGVEPWGICRRSSSSRTSRS